MNIYKEADSKRQAEVIEFLTQSVQQLRKQGNETEAEGLQNLCEKVQSNQFSIVVVGEFSAGKSTFLNAMMHKKILPSFTGETTATVNFLRDCSCAPNGEAGIVYYREPAGKMEVLPDLKTETIEKVVSTRGNKGEKTVASTIDHVDLFLESSFLKDGVMLVDSPGLNGIAEHHKEITEEQIRESHACIFLFNADHPGSRTDFEFLQELKSRNANVFFVLNKIDVIKQSEGETPESVVEQLSDIYREKFPNDHEIPCIWPLSAGMALKARDPEMSREENLSAEQCQALEERSRILPFEERLWKYLTQGERRRAQLCTPVDKTLKTLNAETTRLEGIIELLGQETSSEDLLKKQCEMQEELEALQKERERASRELRDKMRKMRTHMQESAEAKCIDLKNRIEGQLRNRETIVELEEYGNQLGKELQKKYNYIALEMNDELHQELLRMVNEEYQDCVDALDDRFAGDENKAVFQIEPKEFTISDISTGVDLEKFEKEREKLKAEIAELESKRDSVEESSRKEREKERKIEAKRKRLESLEASRDVYQNNFVAPPITNTSLSKETIQKREGFFGEIGNHLFGGRVVVETVVERDSAAYDKAIEERNDVLTRQNREIEKIKNEIAEEEKALSTESSAVLDGQAKRLERYLTEAKNEYNAKVQDINERMDDAQQKKVRRLREQILDKIDDTSDRVGREIKNYLSAQEKTYIRMVQDLVMVNISDALEKKQDALKEVRQAMDGEAKERDEKMKAAVENLNATKQLLQKGVDISIQLEESLNDHVEKEEL